MHATHPIAISIPPLFLRLALAVTFIWAGLGKVFGEMTVQGPTAAILANMDVIAPPGGSSDAPPAAVQAPAPEAPSGEQRSPEQPDQSNTNDENETDQNETDAGTNVSSVFSPSYHLALASFQDQRSPDPIAAAPAPPQERFTAADFPEPQTIQRVYGLAILTKTAAFPPQDADGNTPRPIWPDWAADGRMPVLSAWAAAITEIGVGVLLLTGFLTRLGGLAVAGLMVVAMWLTEIGPAVQAGNTYLGFLPGGRTWYDPGDWTRLLWQFALLMSGLALTFLGSGALAIDRALFRKDPDRYDDADADDDE